MPKLFGFFFLCLLGLNVHADNNKTLTHPEADAVILKVLELIYQQHYSQAESLLSSVLEPDDPGYLYFHGLLHNTRFNDWGDTVSFSKAEKSWQQLLDLPEHFAKKERSRLKSDPLFVLYSGLTMMQLSYTASVRGMYFSSIMQARKAVKALKKQRHYIESQLAIKTFEYYKGQLFALLDWIPFVNPDLKSKRQFLHNHYQTSRYLSVLFGTPLIWMFFDAGEINQGLAMAQGFLEKHPQNRIYRLIEADFYYKLQDYQKAAHLFERVKGEYQEAYAKMGNHKCVKINYLCAVGNLVRVYAALGMASKQKENAAIWFSQETKQVQQWLPASLKKDLKRFE